MFITNQREENFHLVIVGTLEERSDSMERKRQQACEATRLWRERQRVIKGQVTPNMYKSSSLGIRHALFKVLFFFLQKVRLL